MDAVVSTVESWQAKYEWALTRADPRVKDWFLMQSYTPTLVLTGLYLAFVIFVPRLIRSHPPLQLKWSLFFYNIALVLLNLFIYVELFTASYKLGYSYTCQPVDYSDNPDELRIAKALWWYYFSKLVEFLDTVIFILRKKDSQVTFLHVYHHSTMFPIWWIGIKWVPGGQSFFGAMINSFVHVFMYTHYAISALGPDYHKYVWWKRYLTKLQLVQFVLGMGHATRSLWTHCDFPEWMHWALFVYVNSLLVLFLNFYFQAYIKRRRLPKTETAGKRTAEMNGVAAKTKKRAKKQKPEENGVLPASTEHCNGAAGGADAKPAKRRSRSNKLH